MWLGKAYHYDKDVAELKEELEKQTGIAVAAESMFNKLVEEYDEQKVKLDAAEAQIKKLLSDKTVDVLALRDWYEEKFGVTTWLYPIYGDGVLRDARRALLVPDEEQYIIDLLADEIIARYNIVGASPTELVERVKQYFTVKNNWTYVTDAEQYGKADYWERADKSAVTRRGDCEDLSILMHCVIHSLLLKFELQEHYFRLKMTASRVLGEGGHAYNIWLHDDGEWYAVESTYDLQGSFKRTWLKTPIKNNNLYVDFWGFARKDRSFKGVGISSLEKHEEEL